MLPDAPMSGRTDRRGWGMLAILVLVYVLNFIDRQMLTILAPDLKRDLAISDADFGFLYGTAFGVFYALFGIPLGKLADRWSRVRLLALGLTLWSMMTALSGLARNLGQLGLARLAVGVGEATAGPCAYSLISDSFPPRRRATALAIYSAGLYLGGGVSLFLGSTIASRWNAAYPAGAAPFELAGWQAAFIAVGLPGLLLAWVVSRLHEPPRGRFDPGHDADPVAAGALPLASLLRDVAEVLPPFTLLVAARLGRAALALNLAAGLLIALAMAGLAVWTGDSVQWIAFGLGLYATFSWACTLHARAPADFDRLLKARPFVCVSVGYGMVSMVAYAATAFIPTYAIEVLHENQARAGMLLGGIGATSGALGVIGGGLLTDRLGARHGLAMRVAVFIATALLAGLGYLCAFNAASLTSYYLAVPLAMLCSSATFGGAAGVVVNVVPPQLRATATALFLLATNMLGLALGPYIAGRLSEALGGIGAGLTGLLAVVPLALALFGVAYRDLRARDLKKAT